MTSVPGPRAVDDAVRAEQDGLDVRRVRDADDGDVRRRRRPRPACRRMSTPRSASSGARPGVRFQPVTANPARARLAAIAAPIVPRPRKATRPRSGDGSAVMAAGRPVGPAGRCVGRRSASVASVPSRRSGGGCPGGAGAAAATGGASGSRPRAMRNAAIAADDRDQDDDPRQEVAARPVDSGAGAGIGAGDGGGGRARRRRRRPRSRRPGSPVFGLPLVMTGTPATFRHVAAVVADLGGHDVVVGRLDVGDRVRDREATGRPSVDGLGRRCRATRRSPGRPGRPSSRPSADGCDADAGDLAGDRALEQVGPVGQRDRDLARVALGQDRDALAR